MKNKLKFIIPAAAVALSLLCAVLLCVGAVGIGSLVFSLICNDGFDWGEGITENIPEFSREYDSIQTDEEGSYCAAYYSNVTGEEINRYAEDLKAQIGVEFSGDAYPKSAVYEDKIIALHYNVTEMKFSVTVTKALN